MLGWPVGDEDEWAVSERVVEYDHGLCVERGEELFLEYVACGASGNDGSFGA